jgi:glyoxylase-like metal-dependent hydrolase (beta-lactamase superfamily II)
VKGSSGATILVDACVGEHKDRSQRPEWHMREATDFLARLSAAGCEPEDIDIVLCTHLHADHVGWNTRLDNGRWVPTFPNARYIVGRDELSFWQNAASTNPDVNHGSYRDSVLPVLEAGLMEVVAGDGTIADGATVVSLPGHTAGQIGVEITRAGQPVAIICGDAIHSPVQIPFPEWTSFICHDASQAVATRKMLIDRAASSDLLLMPNHLRAAPAMRVKRIGGVHLPAFCNCAGDLL